MFSMLPHTTTNNIASESHLFHYGRVITIQCVDAKITNQVDKDMFLAVLEFWNDPGRNQYASH
jgi:hypothetical protein